MGHTVLRVVLPCIELPTTTASLLRAPVRANAARRNGFRGNELHRCLLPKWTVTYITIVPPTGRKDHPAGTGLFPDLPMPCDRDNFIGDMLSLLLVLRKRNENHQLPYTLIAVFMCARVTAPRDGEDPYWRSGGGGGCDRK